ncbi:MAG: DinB family protein [Flavobacteriales bacterium]|nr:DinB family protein [Flavobacteriales bacterium]
MSLEKTIKNWITRMNAVTNKVVDEFGNLSEEELNRKPNDETWSIAENLQHLIQVNESYYPIIEKIRKGNLKLGFLSRFGFIRNFFGKMILGSVEPERKRKMKTFPIWQPGSSSIEQDVIARFSAHQEHFEEFLRSCQDLLENGQVIHSPANEKIVYTLEQAFEIIVTHEERHLNQALEVLWTYKNP